MIVDPQRELAVLKDFQRDTARYAFQRMYLDPRPALRFLVADEVGLGKTLVARAVLSQVIAHLHGNGDQRIDVVYVCSNAKIAQQNLRRLALAGIDLPASAGRLSLLPGRAGWRRSGINLIALTPGTSLQHGYAPGKLAERALALAYLTSAWGPDRVEDVGVYRAFAGAIGGAEGELTNLRERFRRALGDLRPQHGTKGLFKEELRAVDQTFQQQGRGRSLKETLRWLAAEFCKQPDNRDPQAGRERNRFVLWIRRAMAATGAAMLQPDLVIFDEFQRFADLLHNTDTDAHVLLRRLIDCDAAGNTEATRTLLLSATPYRMHTTDLERASGEDDHYHDLMRTVRFLAGDEDAEATTSELRLLRAALTRVPSDGTAPAAEATRAVSRRLRSMMVRTERLAATTDREGMLTTVTRSVPPPPAEDIRSYLAAASVTARASTTIAGNGTGGRDLVELWKSVPYLLSFLNQENYTAKRALEEALADPGRTAEIAPLLPGNPAALPWQLVESYAAIDPRNVRLRHLVGDTTEPAVACLLWLPACAPYYRAGGPFESTVARRFTKRLVFTSWHAAPTAISTMLSYEAERHTVSAARRELSYGGDGHRRATQPLRFATRSGEPASMSSYPIVHPSVALADAVDPLAIAAALRETGVEPTRESVLARAREVLRPAVGRLTAGHERPPDQAWYWLVPVLLDAQQARRGRPTYLSLPGLTAAPAEEDATAFRAHLRRAADAFAAGTADRSTGSPPDDLLEVVAEVAVASPAVCALRAIRRVLPDAGPQNAIQAAARIASGFRALFNTAEATAIIQGHDDRDFWRACLRYALDGNLQAVLDEYLHVLVEVQHFGRDETDRLAEHVSAPLTSRTVNYRVDAVDCEGRLSRHRMRGHYAIRLGDGHDENNTAVRSERVMDAFNSPFWPFVLATTSIGQEGLDFHLYCHAVVHWNLPHNPVDLEQREGRVHRYKGHAVRKNVAARCGPPTAAGDPWQAMFAAAASLRQPANNEITPYWVFEGEAKIERHLLVPPYTRDASLLPRLLGSAAMYRLAFGQPRQEEFLQTLSSHLDETQQQDLASIAVDLRPRPDVLRRIRT